MKKKITFIGVGNLTQSLLYGFNAISHKNSINLYDIDSKKKKFANKTNITFNDNLHIAVKNADLIIIAVKPKNYRSVCISLNKMDLPNTTIISLMAGVRVKELSNHLNDYNNISRVMTNINAKYLQEISAQVDGNNALFSFNTPSDPVLMQESTDDSAIYVVMPMRV